MFKYLIYVKNMIIINKKCWHPSKQDRTMNYMKKKNYKTLINLTI